MILRIVFLGTVISKVPTRFASANAGIIFESNTQHRF
jgi:hypothetical protein